MSKKLSKIDSALTEAKSLIHSDPDRATTLADWAFKQSQANNHLKGQGDALAIFSNLYVDTNPNASLDFATKASTIFQQIGDKTCEAETLLTIALTYNKSGWTSRAHYMLVRAHELSEQANNPRLSGTLLFNLGANAESREDLASALDYFTCAKVFAEEFNQDKIYWRAVCAEQEMHYRLNDGLFDIKKIKEVFDFGEAVDMEKTRIETEMFLSKVAHDKSDFRLARTRLRRAYSLASTIADGQLKAEIICLLGENRLDDGKHRSARKLLKIALGLSKSLELSSLELTCLKLLSRAFAGCGDLANSLELMTKYTEAKDELYAHESKIHFQEMRTVQDLKLLEEESRVLKQTNVELAAVNDRLEATLQEKRTLQKELVRLATIDELTGALNRREAMSFGSEIISRFHTQGRPGVVMIVDIDHFKSINDGFGHSAGDEVLRRFTKSCQKVLRPTDRFGRLGGEEFCILLDRTSLEIALKVAERVMNSIRSCRVADILGDRIITASIGIVEVSRKHQSIEAALQDADLGLYEAKRSGRDKICITGVKKKKAA